ncbi:hypothetical protein BK125_04800 [Paenibacillus odorifer]|uniref:HTH cro/C1-type domain-containing protein n=1 Tax=Paenibacillus odorifer TaxID=189426 RepID=A0ABX3GQS7_9BACL|nr:helix-turn-helix transcriptional regulator [Paenibacillus odorifer]OMC79602.1 hypothetical protein BK125_04800 [Paenibacillus odorifer]OMD34948.1 hypothetical protein BSO21_10045 [Paenibacillus odorifer]
MSLFSERVRYARELKNLSQKEVAEKVSMSQQGYSNIETGRREPSLSTLRLLRHILEESLDFFIGYNIEDSRGGNLYELYAEARRIRIEAEEDLEYSENMLENPEEDVEKRMKMIRRYKDHLKEAQQKEEKAFNMFYDHIIKVPGYDEYEVDKEYWIKIYDTYQENDNKMYHEFWEDYRSL